MEFSFIFYSYLPAGYSKATISNNYFGRSNYFGMYIAETVPFQMLNTKRMSGSQLPTKH